MRYFQIFSFLLPFVEAKITIMRNKLNFVLFGFLCLGAACYAEPSSSQESSEETNMKSFVEHLKLFVLTVEEFADLNLEIVEKGPKVFTEVLMDPKILEVKTEAMQGQTKILRDYLDKFEIYKRDHNKAHIFELVDEFDDIINKFDSNHSDLSPEAAIIEKSLKEHGLENVTKSIHKHFEKFLVKFSAEVDPYLNGLNEKEKENEKDFIEWYEKLKSEKDIAKKIELFDNFVEDDD